MSVFDQIKLEVVRPGPSNNQLLSPLTQYMALCGESAPTTFSIGLEHHELLSKLSRLRYISQSRTAIGTESSQVPDSIRQSTVAELGKDMSAILASLKPLLVEEWKALGAARAKADLLSDQQRRPKSFVHVRLVASGSEFSILPFELSTAPEASPGEGGDWLLDARLPVVLTREVRKSVSGQVSWKLDKPPKILVIIASPGQATVPAQQHINVITKAMEPWIGWPENEIELDNAGVKRERLEEFGKSVHILQNASIQKIQRKCIENEYTHVHILAHGGSYQFSSDERFGVVLCNDKDHQKPEVVSGKRLATALTSQGAGGQQKSIPKFVCLATCDSGNVGSVYTPGGSIAHDMHVAGIPWVIASQFPLTKRGSIIMARQLYTGILRGDDPRSVLHDVRRDLLIDSERNHDWASIIAYASFDDRFDTDVHETYQLQSRRRIETSLGRIDHLEGNAEKIGKNDIPAAESIRDKSLKDARLTLEDWKTRLPPISNSLMESRSRRSEYHGMCGSKSKREALMHGAHMRAIEKYDSNNTVLIKRLKAQEKSELTRSLSYYLKGVEEQAFDSTRFHWTATQALSLMAILKKEPDIFLYQMTLKHAEQQSLITNGTDCAWSHGTLAELVILGPYHEQGISKRAFSKRMETELAEKTKFHCIELVKKCVADTFPIESTCRQFKRYRDIDLWKNEYWNDAVAGGIIELDKGLSFSS